MRPKRSYVRATSFARFARESELVTPEARKCPLCGGLTVLDTVDIGVGEIPCGPPYCEPCQWVEEDPLAALYKTETDPAFDRLKILIEENNALLIEIEAFTEEIRRLRANTPTHDCDECDVCKEELVRDC